ncbi:hypothetical protein DFP73DRAFT_600625 [Morchella snyderi]|nr:hypothetical protein DFP73DRAFT_600625 [Morchella snyderi]
MSNTQRIELVKDVLGKLGHNNDLLDRLTLPETYNMLSAADRQNTLVQLRVSAEVLWRVAEVARMDGQMAQSAAAARGGAAAT